MCSLEHYFMYVYFVYLKHIAVSCIYAYIHATISSASCRLFLALCPAALQPPSSMPV